MSSIRTVKPEFFASESLARCCRDARLTFEGLWCEADCEGRGVANAKVLAGRLWPHDDDIGPLEVEDHLQQLTKEHIELYEVDGKRYYAVLNWENHQAESYRRGKPRYPEPPLWGTRGNVPAPRGIDRKGREGKGREGATSARNNATPAPEEFTVTAALKEWATRNGYGWMNLDGETAKFLDHHVAKGSVFKDWGRAWQKWIRQASDWATQRNGAVGASSQRDLSNVGAPRAKIAYGPAIDLSDHE